MKPKTLVCGGCGISNTEGVKQRHTIWCAWWLDRGPYTYERRWAW